MGRVGGRFSGTYKMSSFRKCIAILRSFLVFMESRASRVCDWIFAKLPWNASRYCEAPPHLPVHVRNKGARAPLPLEALRRGLRRAAARAPARVRRPARPRARRARRHAPPALQLGFSVSHFRWSTVRGRFTEAYGGILKSFFKRRIRSPIIKFNVYTIKFIA